VPFLNAARIDHERYGKVADHSVVRSRVSAVEDANPADLIRRPPLTVERSSRQAVKPSSGYDGTALLSGKQRPDGVVQRAYFRRATFSFRRQNAESVGTEPGYSHFFLFEYHESIAGFCPSPPVTQGDFAFRELEESA
jgi:hypothetical protein